MKIHEKYIKRCLELAKNGLGNTRPNPMVGSVIIHNNTIIGEGYTSPYGGSHAEVNAIDSVKDKNLLKEATMYVSLEPCSHFGKTPPCSDLIIKHKIPRVVIGCGDTSDKVAGKGIENLKKHGCEVHVGVMENDCIALNKRFFTHQLKKRPYIILKWAETKDGFIDRIRKEKDETKPNWITNQYSRQLVHKWRSEEQAILVGTDTAINDNPKLDVRNWKGINPDRMVLDRSLKIPRHYNLMDNKVKTIIFTEKEMDSKENLLYKKVDFSKDLSLQICTYLYEQEKQSVIVEGGAQTIQTFIDANLWDEARIFIGTNKFKNGIKAPVIKGVEIYEQDIQSDRLKVLKNANC